MSFDVTPDTLTCYNTYENPNNRKQFGNDEFWRFVSVTNGCHGNKGPPKAIQQTQIKTSRKFY